MFWVVGIDLARPFYLKGNTKSWIVIFKCAIFRAVHFWIGNIGNCPVLDWFLNWEDLYLRMVGHMLSAVTMVQISLGLRICWSAWLEEYYRRNLCPENWLEVPSTHCSLVGLVVGMYCLCDQEAITTRTRLCLHELRRDDILADCKTRPWTYLSEDQNDLLALTPTIFIQEVVVLDLDCIDKVNFPRRFQYQTRLLEKLRRRFRVRTWVSSSNIGMRFYVTDDTDWSSRSYWWWQQKEDRLACGKSFLSVPKKVRECKGW